MYVMMRIKGTVQGHRVVVLVDNGAAHNFIDAQMVVRIGIHTKSFDGLLVLVLVDRAM